MITYDNYLHIVFVIKLSYLIFLILIN